MMALELVGKILAHFLDILCIICAGVVANRWIRAAFRHGKTLPINAYQAVRERRRGDD